MKNVGLKNSIKHLIKNAFNIKLIIKGNVGGLSIEIETIEPPSYDSYLYKDKLIRDNDFDELTELITIKN